MKFLGLGSTKNEAIGRKKDWKRKWLQNLVTNYYDEYNKAGTSYYSRVVRVCTIETTIMLNR